MHLIGSSLSPYVGRVELQLALKGQSLEVKPRPGQPGTPEMDVENPFGKIPILVTEAGNLIDSVAIMEYLETVYADSVSLLPSDQFELAKMRALIYSFDQYVLVHQMPFYYKLFGMGTTDEDFSKAREGMSDGMSKIAKLLAKDTDYLSGASISLSDCAFAPFFPLMANVCERLQVSNPLLETGEVVKWWEHISGHEDVAAVTQTRVAELEKMLAG